MFNKGCVGPWGPEHCKHAGPGWLVTCGAGSFWARSVHFFVLQLPNSG